MATTPVIAPVPVQAVVVSQVQAEKSENRRDWALILLSGGAMVMTLFAAVCLFLVREHANFVFYLGLAAMVQTFAVLTGLMGLLVKRSLKLSRSGVEIVDEGVFIPEEERSHRDDDDRRWRAPGEDSGSTDKQG